MGCSGLGDPPIRALVSERSQVSWAESRCGWGLEFREQTARLRTNCRLSSSDNDLLVLLWHLSSFLHALGLQGVWKFHWICLVSSCAVIPVNCVPRPESILTDLGRPEASTRTHEYLLFVVIRCVGLVCAMPPPGKASLLYVGTYPEFDQWSCNIFLYSMYGLADVVVSSWLFWTFLKTINNSHNNTPKVLEYCIYLTSVFSGYFHGCPNFRRSGNRYSLATTSGSEVGAVCLRVLFSVCLQLSVLSPTSSTWLLCSWVVGCYVWLPEHHR